MLRISRNEKGQVSIFIGSMMLTFLLFLAFVVNTGMLVNAKINLQNAADLAAYAGAAVQARQLNDIGYLNYEMRRTLKKFLFRYYVIGNVTQPTFPRSNPGSGAARFAVEKMDLTGPSQMMDIGVPTTCVTFLPNDNYCAIRGLPTLGRVNAGPVNNLDALMGALDEQYKQLEDVRKKGCFGIGQMNQMLMLYWLWNTDPNLEEVTTQLAAAGGDATYVARLRVLKSLASGIGLIPREIFLRKRIDTLNRYVNFAPQSDVDVAKVNALKGGGDWAMHERTIQAYLSAFHTLGNNTFSNDITMDEVLPTGPMGANLLTLQNLTAEFDAFATDFSIDDGAPCQPTTNEQAKLADRDSGCVQCLVSYPQSERHSGFKPVFGVAKDPAVMTYYAIRLQAQAQLLFSPYGNLTLTAYAAAQPFGSRIGPPQSEARFTSPGGPSNTTYSRCGGIANCQGEIPNIPVKEGESASPTLDSGWAQNDVLFHMYSGGLRSNPSSPVPQTIQQPDLLRAYHVAMAPNPWERGRYQIPNDANTDPFLESFDAKGVRAIWAPLFTGSSTAATANPADEIIGYIGEMATNYTTQSNSAKEVFSAAAQNALVTQINRYVNNYLRNGTGEDGEGLNVVRIFDPISTRTDLSGSRAPLATTIPSTILMRDAARLKTSWNQVLANDGAHPYRTLGRTGYSVKFVPLNLLRSASGITTNGTDTFSNRLPASNGVGPDIVEMKH
jgi:hypothetical protein